MQEKHQEAGHLAKLAGQPLVLSEDELETEFLEVLKNLAAQRDEQRWEYLQAKVQLGSATAAEKSEYTALSSAGSLR
jgi:hypothetical protein